jgi:hypothetical protein
MANNNYLETLSGLFSETASPSKEKVMGLMDETMQFFREIKEKLSSSDPEEQKKAFEETMEMKRILETKIKELTEKTGLSITELTALAEKPNAMKPEEKDIYAAAKARLELLKDEEIPHKSKHLKTHKIKG